MPFHLKNSFLFLLLLFLTNCSKEQQAEDTCSIENSTYNPSTINNKVLIIGIDGFRSDALTPTSAPFLYSFARENTSFFNDEHLSETNTVSGPNWGSLLTGVHSTKHNIIDNTFVDYKSEQFPHFFEYIEKAYSNINTVSVCNWPLINLVITLDKGDLSLNQFYNDQEVFDLGQNILLNETPAKADVLFLHFDNLDHEGHAFGYHDSIPEYRQSVQTMDGYVENLVQTINTKRANGENWMIFVVSDHGGTGIDHSNYNDIHTRNTIFIANHPTLNFKQAYESNQVDLVPTILTFMGIENASFTCNKDGVSLIE